MPLLRRRPVPLLPLPDTSAISDDTRVFYLKATGEIFLDYEAYAARLSFLLLRQFQCEYSGKTNLDYFSALQSEKAESRVVRERFPDELKGRVLGTVQFRVMGRLDSLVDLVYERYKDRFFANEKIFVDLGGGDKYFAKVAKVFPPQNVRDSAPSPSPAPTASTSSAPAPAGEDYSAVAHKVGCDLNVDPKVARSSDDPDEYLYTVQLMDEEHKFEGSFMEVKARQLSRDRLAFSKSILKRYMRECLMRDPAIGSPWMVKPSIARAFGIPTSQSGDEEERNRQMKEAKLAKRRKTLPEGSGGVSEGAPPKKRKTADGSSTPAGHAHKAHEAHDSNPSAASKKPVKYPIEDLDLDAMSIIDGRVLRRVNQDVPALPVKPQPKRTLLVPEDCFDRFIETWNMLNIFSTPLFISNFTLDEYAAALQHDTLTPRCVLFLEIHASLTNIIGTDNSRVLGSTTAVSSHAAARAGAAGGASATPVPGEGDAGTPMKEEPNPVDQLGGGAGAGGEGDEADQAQLDILAYEQSELNRLVRLGISYGKRWDRQAKLKYADGREGWERHLIGALCQRGGPLYLERFVQIMRHLFKGHPDLPKPEEEEGAEANGANGVEADSADVKPKVEGGEASAAGGAVAPKQEGDVAAPGEEEEEADLPDTSNPEEAYLSLPLGDKLDIIGYLCTLVMGSKAVRGYVDECDAKLTELRKTRADVNKERKALLEQKTNLEQGIPISLPSTPLPALPSANGDAMEVDSRAPSETGEAPSSASRAKADDAGDDEDQLDSDAESTAAASEAGSTLSVSKRQAQLEEKRLASLAEGAAGRGANIAQLREAAKAKTQGVIARSTVEDKIRTNELKDEECEREFRRYQGVSRCRPLGKDRFHCRYWWFDGVGGMELVDARAGETLYGTGRLFVQGPSAEDWEMIADLKVKGEEGEKEMRERRAREEVAAEVQSVLGVNEWAYYEDEDEIENLLTWLNSKGTRELALKTAISKWRGFILAGARKRQHDAAHPELPRYDQPEKSGRRSSRAKHEPELLNDYMGWRNPAHKY